MKYDVTIGIPVYNAAPYIRQTLISALSQSYTSIELLIVEDGGTDASIAIIQEIKSNHPRGECIRIISHCQNQGVSKSRNQIIEEAQGDYLYFMDSDDLIAENTIELLFQNICQNKAEIAFGSYERIEVSGERTLYQYPSLRLLKDDELATFAYRKYGGIQASACNFLVKTSVLRENHLSFVDVNYWEDMAFTFNLVTCISRAVLLPDITYTYCCRENSLSQYQRRKSISKDEILRNIKVGDYLKETSSTLYNKVYYANRCYIIMMTDFYVACNIIKHRKITIPRFTDKEVQSIFSHPATLRQIISFQQFRIINLAFYLFGLLPAFFVVSIVRMLGKIKKLV